ncbi:MAG: hypothetical protein ASARMPREDX12_002336 [Alectoria sarmentosa]|nr:MAG: hypothetical protein ASARMPRED_007254 [Alectoria sarmentosa]CAD6586326.1 MAG: hypothetical protein ASARMPREDX12_002336 [Alectoria sarmentosa]
MPVNWKDPDAFTRLLAAMVAAQDMKLDYRKIATMYGNGATYDSIEGRFRIIKKEATIMKAEIDSGERSEAPARGTTSANTTSKKPKSAANTPKKEKIIGGRVGKSNGTPSKNRGKVVKGVKQEPDSSSSSSFVEVHSTEEDEDFATNVEGGHSGRGSRAPQSGVEGGDFTFHYEMDYVDDSMDVGAF